jgi:hypothetical protein
VKMEIFEKKTKKLTAGKPKNSRLPRNDRKRGETIKNRYPREIGKRRGKLKFQISPCGGETSIINNNFFPRCAWSRG